MATESEGAARKPGSPPETDVLVGNYHDKYESTNPAIRWLTLRFLARLDAILDRIEASGSVTRVLEIGCGEGEVTQRLSERWNVTAIDLPDAYLRSRWQSVTGSRFCHADAARLPFADDVFDLVVAVEVLEHVPDPEVCLRECARVGRQHLVLSVPREPLFRMGNLAAGRHVRALGNTPGHLQHWSTGGFRQLAGTVGEVRSVEKPLPWTIAWVALDGRADTLAVGDDSDLQSEAMETRRAAPNYQRWLADLAVPWLGDRPLEIGSGLGDYAAEWAARGVRIIASEADDERLRALRARFAWEPLVDVRRLQAPISEAGTHTAAVSYNVLEHIEDDVEALRSFASLVAPGGFVVTLVPAFGLAMSHYDREIGHYRRYRRPQLEAAMRAAGLEVTQCYYVNAPGLLLWTLTMRMLKLRRTGDSASRGLRLYDRLVPAIRAVESRWRPPFGQSLFAVARVPARSN